MGKEKGRKLTALPPSSCAGGEFTFKYSTAYRIVYMIQESALIIPLYGTDKLTLAKPEWADEQPP